MNGDSVNRETRFKSPEVKCEAWYDPYDLANTTGTWNNGSALKRDVQAAKKKSCLKRSKVPVAIAYITA